MKRNFTLLTILGALIAMAVPASSMASNVSIWPANSNFEISGERMPQISSSLTGTCSFTKITGTTPKAPANENPTSVGFATPPPTASCGAGVSITIAPNPGGIQTWGLLAFKRNRVEIVMPTAGITLRYTSLPGCKLATTGLYILGEWGNNEPSTYRADASVAATWANDGGACAMAGKAEPIKVYTGGTTTINAPVANTSFPGQTVQIGGGGI